MTLTELFTAVAAGTITPQETEREAGWQPIATAPRDGTSILLFIKGHYVCEGWFSSGSWSDETPESPREYDGSTWVCCDDAMQFEVEETEEGFWDIPVTHWMPLPLAPKEDAR